ncbi:MAG: Xaa-Pro dipeptidase [Rhodanobacter sp.]|jgi:Xaa-Pro dipeptidase|nr:Xaa-Pro dipeptidase [Rhodanobacter sp.]
MDHPHPDLHRLYPPHIATLQARTAAALERAGCDHLLIAAGRAHAQFLDDRDYPFCANPHFKHWLPVTKAPGSWLVITPGRRPKLVYLQPRDYWHVVPEAPAGYWVEHFDIAIIRDAEAARAHLPKNTARCAILGETNAAVGDAAPNNPQAVIDYLHYQRSYKTPYELAMMRVASKIGARAHRAAEAAFRAGEAEFGIHIAYMAAAMQSDDDLPYSNIIALNEHAAVLHYTGHQHAPPAHIESFLIDAGASFHGYAADITRTYATSDGEFHALIAALEQAQRGFCAQVRAKQSYPELHIHAHHVLAGLLKEHGFIRMSEEIAVESGVSSAFFPHGLGHPLGLQVHDVAGFQASDRGGTLARPPGHPYLRMTRTLEPGMVVTIEPGLYFIDMLLAELKAKSAAKDVDWNRVDAFRKYGGIRIEDNVVCTQAEPENLTRDAFEAV